MRMPGGRVRRHGKQQLIEAAYVQDVLPLPWSTASLNTSDPLGPFWASPSHILGGYSTAETMSERRFTERAGVVDPTDAV
jgi:hypothetical protein